MIKPTQKDLDFADKFLHPVDGSESELKKFAKNVSNFNSTQSWFRKDLQVSSRKSGKVRDFFNKSHLVKKWIHKVDPEQTCRQLVALKQKIIENGDINDVKAFNSIVTVFNDNVATEAKHFVPQLDIQFLLEQFNALELSVKEKIKEKPQDEDLKKVLSSITQHKNNLKNIFFKNDTSKKYGGGLDPLAFEGYSRVLQTLRAAIALPEIPAETQKVASNKKEEVMQQPDVEEEFSTPYFPDTQLGVPSMQPSVESEIPQGQQPDIEEEFLTPDFSGTQSSEILEIPQVQPYDIEEEEEVVDLSDVINQASEENIIPKYSQVDRQQGLSSLIKEEPQHVTQQGVSVTQQGVSVTVKESENPVLPVSRVEYLKKIFEKTPATDSYTNFVASIEEFIANTKSCIENSVLQIGLESFEKRLEKLNNACQGLARGSNFEKSVQSNELKEIFVKFLDRMGLINQHMNDSIGENIGPSVLDELIGAVEETLAALEDKNIVGFRKAFENLITSDMALKKALRKGRVEQAKETNTEGHTEWVKAREQLRLALKGIDSLVGETFDKGWTQRTQTFYDAPDKFAENLNLYEAHVPPMKHLTARMQELEKVLKGVQTLNPGKLQGPQFQKQVQSILEKTKKVLFSFSEEKFTSRDVTELIEEIKQQINTLPSVREGVFVQQMDMAVNEKDYKKFQEAAINDLKELSVLSDKEKVAYKEPEQFAEWLSNLAKKEVDLERKKEIENIADKAAKSFVEQAKPKSKVVEKALVTEEKQREILLNAFLPIVNSALADGKEHVKELKSAFSGKKVGDCAKEVYMILQGSIIQSAKLLGLEILGVVTDDSSEFLKFLGNLKSHVLLYTKEMPELKKFLVKIEQVIQMVSNAVKGLKDENISV